MTVACSTQAPHATAPAGHAAHSPHWSYDGPTSALHWAELEPGFQTCGIGQEQSPINIETSRVTASPDARPLGFGYTPSEGSVVNNGHTIQVDLAQAGSLVLDDGAYGLVQFHFHTPSEEQIDGQSYPLVAHLVHRNEQGRLAVVAVLFKLGQENAALKPVFAKLPTDVDGRRALTAPLDVTALLPATRAHYAFAGSLTTPPCSEGVRWHVLKTPVEISPAQLAAFKAIYTMNARPVQPLNGRAVRLVP
ncbi:carbonic anhydrase [Ideonella lacteola]